MDINSRLKALRKVMKERNINAFIVPSSDNHGSEYVSEFFRVRAWLTGFTGSAGTVVITENEAHLWTDGRYFLQAAEQIKGSDIILERMGEPGVKSYIQWIVSNVEAGSTVSFNGKVFTVAEYHGLEKAFAQNGIKIAPQEDIFNDLWEERPPMPKAKIFIHEIKYAGKSVAEKLKEVKERLGDEQVDNMLLSSLDDIAWLLNLRGADVQCNPVFLSYFLLQRDKNILYIDKNKVDEVVKNYLNKNNVEIKDYEEVVHDLKALEGSITFDPNKTNVWLKNALSSSVRIKESRNITTILKARKNEVELKNIERAHIKDGVAMVRFLKWIKDAVKNENITEISAAERLKSFREEGEGFIDLSFDTIAGYGPHGAIIHYKANEETNSQLKPEGLFLVDSGAQYLDGTTDITRTIALGHLTQEEIDDYTLVLKGHLNLENALFIEGAPGCSLDILARRPLWNRCLDYKHGTGHGVGYFLNVHEGPQGIRTDLNAVPLEVGMVLSNEPGIYRAGKHGVRIENLIAVEFKGETEFGRFLGFKGFTLCPYEIEAINIELLNKEEIDWINNYHERVFEILSPYLNKEEVDWLKNATKKIG